MKQKRALESPTMHSIRHLVYDGIGSVSELTPSQTIHKSARFKVKCRCQEDSRSKQVQEYALNPIHKKKYQLIQLQSFVPRVNMLPLRFVARDDPNAPNIVKQRVFKVNPSLDERKLQRTLYLSSQDICINHTLHNKVSI